jgi:rubrerythrin
MIKVRIFKEIKYNTNDYEEALNKVKTMIKEDIVPSDFQYSWDHMTDDEQSIIVFGCVDCGNTIEDDWSYCPNCGSVKVNLNTR